MKQIVILGSTGSLGRQSLEVISKHPKKFRVIGLCANKKREMLEKQAKQYGVSLDFVRAASVVGEKKCLDLVTMEAADIIINVLPGLAGLEATRAALKSKKKLLLGNKESLVAAGEEIMNIPGAKENLISIDSEHNAIAEIIMQNPGKEIEKIIIPCSGGPFIGKTKDELKGLLAEDALEHPRWKMGKKVTIESATLINKGFEIIEAHFLFDLPLEKIKTMIHPQCMIHGVVEFKNETYAYLSEPDMREHIENSLLRAIGAVPETSGKIKPLKNMEILEPDHETFPGIKIVLSHFRDDPKKMKEFLIHEEAVIEKFLIGDSEFLDIFKELQKK